MHQNEGLHNPSPCLHHRVTSTLSGLLVVTLHKPVSLYLGPKSEFSHPCTKSSFTRCAEGTISQLLTGEQPHYALLCPLLPLPPITPNTGYNAMVYFAVVLLKTDKGLSALQAFLLLSLLGNLNHHYCFLHHLEIDD